MEPDIERAGEPMTTPPQEHPVKAVLYRLIDTPAGTAEKPPVVQADRKSAVTVQFNPTSLKLERNNDTSGGATSRAQRRNRPNEGHAKLSVELEFDTAEGGPDGSPLDVRTKTQDVRQFVEPPKGAPKKAPPRIRFEWGTFRFDGIVEHLSEEIDYFNADGMALRAKVTLAITGQDPAFESNASGPGARDDKAATQPGGAPESTGPNAAPTSSPTQAVAAQDGESVQQLLTRLGADPAAWRSAMAGLTSPLALTAGVQVQLGASASAGTGVGVTAGFGAAAGNGAGDVTSADTGTGAGPGGTVGFAAEASVGFALSAGGGLAAAVGRTLSRAADQAVAGARGSFDVPGSAVNGPPAGGAASGSAQGTAGGGLPSGGAASGGGPGTAAASVDPRAVSYGYGVPLRPRIVLQATPAAPATCCGPAETAQRTRDARPSTLRWSPNSTGCC